MAEQGKQQGEWIHNSEGVGETGGKASRMHPGGHQKQGWGWRSWLWPIGLIGPFIGSVISIVIIIALLWGLKFVNVILESEFITQIINSMGDNIALFFLFFLFTSYAKFFMMRSRTAYILLHPLSEAAATLFAAWILGWLLSYTGDATNVPLVSEIGSRISANLIIIFAVVLALGYLSIAIGRDKQRMPQ